MWRCVWALFAVAAGNAAHATACSTFPSQPITCDGRAWSTQIWSIDPAQLNGYNSCSALSQAGPEWIFPLPCPYDGPVEVTLYDTDCDVDLYILGQGCSPGAGCLEFATTSVVGRGVVENVSFDCQVGITKYIVIEGYSLGNAPSTCPWDHPQQRNYRYTDVITAVTCDEICGDGFDNDLNGAIDCLDPACPCAEDCATVGDEDRDGRADCADTDCRGLPGCCDLDGDGVDVANVACGGTDCDDGQAAIFPGQSEIVANGVDEDCDGVDQCWTDRDGDGFGVAPAIPGDNLVCGDVAGESARSDDCLDWGAGSFWTWPGAREGVGDGLDQDCDGVDHCYRDLDGDSWGAGAGQPGPGMDCDAAMGWSSRLGDCADQGNGAGSRNPDAAEVCDGVDNDCDLLVDAADPDVGASTTVWPDGDGDGYGQLIGAVILDGCQSQAGYAAISGDCDDADPLRSPGEPERAYDGLDQDCSGADLVDLDGDGWDGPVADCDDSDPRVSPARAELANGVDDNCDGVVDEGTARFDGDGDGFAVAGGDCDEGRADVSPSGVEVCDGADNDCDALVDDGTACVDDDGDGYSEDAGDCADNDSLRSPAAAEVPGNGVDDDCDGVVDVFAVDDDDDGFAASAGDCDDADAAVSPNAVDVPNGVDDDCDGRVDEGTDRYDDDADGFSEALGDCWDNNPLVFPGAAEASNGVDDDCDGRVDDLGDFADGDRDGWTVSDGDCDDASRDVYPGGREFANDVDDDCDGVVDEGLSDLDGDGVTVGQGDCDDQDGWRRPGAVEECDGVDNDCDGTVDPGCEVVEEAACAGCAVGGAPSALWVAGLVGLARRRRP